MIADDLLTSEFPSWLPVSSTNGQLKIYSCQPLFGPANTPIIIKGSVLRSSSNAHVRIAIGGVHCTTRFTTLRRHRSEEEVAFTALVCAASAASPYSSTTVVPIQVEIFNMSRVVVDQAIVAYFTYTDAPVLWGTTTPNMSPIASSSALTANYVPSTFDFASPNLASPSTCLYTTDSPSTLNFGNLSIDTRLPSGMQAFTSLQEPALLAILPSELMSSHLITPTYDISFPNSIPLSTPGPTSPLYSPSSSLYCHGPFSIASLSSSPASSLIETPPSIARNIISSRRLCTNHLHHKSIPTAIAAPLTNFVQLVTHTNMMIVNWSPSETSACRRLVRFLVERIDAAHRRVSCTAIPPAEYVANADMPDTFSCVARPDGGHIITSVDLVGLAGLLYGDKPEVDERNRLRRHLERLKPKTIGKTRDTKGLYNLIASFDKPRALSITKEVKVFNWELMPYAIEYIMAKRVCYSLPYLSLVKL
jgi:hypothetical protein